MKKLDHGMLLNSKYVMDNAIPELQKIKDLIAEPLHDRFDKLLEEFEADLVECDVADKYEEKP